MDVREDDLPRLYREYFSSRTQWRAIGCALGVSAADLEAIEINQRGKCEDCFLQVLINWLRKRGRKTEEELRQAIDLCNVEEDASLFPNWRYIYTIVTLLSILSAIPAVHVHRWLTASSLTTAAHSLKGLYRYHPVVEFELLDFTANMPYINVTMEQGGMTVDFWKLLNRLDSKHQMQLHTTNQLGKLERILITGHPGAGKTTLMRYLAKEWANGRRLQSCKVLFLFQLGDLSKDKEPQSLSDLLQLSPYNDLDLAGLSKEIQQRQGAGACFLLDSYDKWIWKKDFVYRLFFSFNLHSSLCILTSRPHSSLKYGQQPNIEYITMTGFKNTDLKKHLETLSTDDNVTSSIQELWSSNNHIKSLCRLPLNMVMLLSIIKNGEGSDFNTRTEIYSAFMNVTVKHFSDHLQGWNTLSLWGCILNVSDSYSKKLCIAFKELCRVAFEMFFNGIDTFPNREEISSDINKLGFVKITRVDSNGDEVKYAFYHPTFQEFFAAIHLLDLNQKELLYFYIKERRQRMTWYQRNNPWLFCFGLLGAHWRSREDNVAAILRHISVYEGMRYSHGTHTFKYIQEIGWTSENLNRLLDSAGIVENSTLYISGTNFHNLEYVFAHANIHELRFEAPGCKGYMNLKQKMVLYWRWKSCLYLLDRNRRTYRDTHKSCLYTLRCLHGIFPDLRSSVHVNLVDNYNFSPAIKGMDKYLNLTLSIGPIFCGDELWSYINILNKLPRRYTILVKELEIQIETSKSPWHTHSYCDSTCGSSRYFDPDSCFRRILTLPVNEYCNTKLQKLSLCHIHGSYRYGFSRYFDPDSCFGILTSLFKEVKQYKLQKLIFTGPKDGSLARNNMLRDTICELKELQTLVLHSVGYYEVKRLLPCLPPTLQELNLCENNLTDQNVIVIAQELKHLHELKSLSLCGNFIEGSSLQSLVEILVSHPTFSSLDLSYNHLKLDNDGGGIKALGSLLNLRELKIKGSRVDAQEVVNVLVSNKIRLHSLHITVSSSTGFRSLLPIAQLHSLRHLDISERFEVEIKRKSFESDLLVEILKNLTKLETFKLCDQKWFSLVMNDELRWSMKSIHLARLFGHYLPHLQLFRAPCLNVTID